MTDSIPVLQTCVKCGIKKPATREHFSPRPRNTSGLDHRCKNCERIRRKGEYAENPDRLKKAQKKYRDANHDWWLQRTRKWREENPDKVKAYTAKYYNEHAETIRAYSRDYYWKHRPHYLTIMRLYGINHPDVISANKSRRRARELNAEGSHSASDVRLQYKSQYGKCWWCGKRLNGQYHVDHVQPLSRGGSNWPNNIVCACRKCNQSKKDKTPIEWCGRLF